MLPRAARAEQIDEDGPRDLQGQQQHKLSLHCICSAGKRRRGGGVCQSGRALHKQMIAGWACLLSRGF